MKLYVGNLPFAISETELATLFSEFGSVQSANIINDRETGRSKGFGFVEMSSNEEAKNAMAALNGKEFNGRNIKVNEARVKEERPRQSRRY
jgi:RNA recognition motif-containing protein